MVILRVHIAERGQSALTEAIIHMIVSFDNVEDCLEKSKIRPVLKWVSIINLHIYMLFDYKSYAYMQQRYTMNNMFTLYV